MKLQALGSQLHSSNDDKPAANDRHRKRFGAGRRARKEAVSDSDANANHPCNQQTRAAHTHPCSDPGARRKASPWQRGSRRNACCVHLLLFFSEALRSETWLDQTLQSLKSLLTLDVVPTQVFPVATLSFAANAFKPSAKLKNPVGGKSALLPKLPLLPHKTPTFAFDLVQDVKESPDSGNLKSRKMRQYSESMPMLNKGDKGAASNVDHFVTAATLRGISKPQSRDPAQFHSLLEITHIPNSKDSEGPEIPSKWSETIAWLRNGAPQGQLPRGASTVFLAELSGLESELQEASNYLNTWGGVQAKALEALVGVNGKSSSALAHGNAMNASVTAIKETPPKSKASPSKSHAKAKSARTARGVSISVIPGRDPRTGIIVGMQEAACIAPQPDTNLIVAPKTPPESWPEALWDPAFKVTPIYISNALVKLSQSEEVLEKLRIMSDSKGDWLAKIIQERDAIVERISALKVQVAQAQHNMEWVSSHRSFARSKSMMVEATFSDYARDGTFRLPALKPPGSDLVITEAEILKIGAATTGIFNQVRNVMTSRTDNGLQNVWIMKKNLSDNTQVPGILEVETDQLRELGLADPKSLEPKRIIVRKERNSMRPFREDDIQLLERMRNRINYLKNPRFPGHLPKDCIGILRDDVMPIMMEHRGPEGLSTMKALKSLGGGIVAIPSSIFFTDYQPFQTYTKYLTIKNWSSHSARFRLCCPPPYEYSDFFKITLETTPSVGDGLIAPGMGCQYRIDFTPQSLANYEQILTVCTELGTNVVGVTFDPFQVVLSGMRVAPELTIPDVLHCGPCRSGVVAVKKWRFKNIGGPGRFLIKPNDEEINPADEFAKMGLFDKEQAYLDGIRLNHEQGVKEVLSEGAFDISPSYFSLASGETEEITIKFKAAPMDSSAANSTRHDEVLLQIACDNCQVLELPVRANVQIPAVSITGCEPASMRILDELSWDVEGVRFLFGNQNLQATTKLKLTVRNQTRLRLPFYWDTVDNPGNNTAASEKQYSVSETLRSTLSTSDSFSFDPASGYFGPHSDIIFEVSFIPRRAKNYDVIGRLLLMEEGDRVLTAPNGDLLTINSELASDKDCCLEIFCSGVGLDYVVESKPQMILTPTIAMGSSWEGHIKILNDSVSSVTCEWSTQNLDLRIVGVSVANIETDEVGPRANKEFHITFTGNFPGDIDGALVCKTANGVGPSVRIPVTGKVSLAPGDLEFGQMFVDFGLIALGSTSGLTLPFQNKSKMSLQYRLITSSKTFKDGDLWHLSISEPEGRIEPGETKQLQLLFVPLWYQKFNGIITCEIISPVDGMVALVTAIGIFAQVDTPRAKILHPYFNLTSYVNEPLSTYFEIENETMLTSKFTWIPVMRDDVSIQFEPHKKELLPGETTRVNVEATFKKIGPNQIINMECLIDGMVENGGILRAKITSNVVGLRVHMEVDKREDLFLDFGTDCPIFETRTRSLVIRNKSAIAAPFRIWVENFSSTLLEHEIQETRKKKAHAAELAKQLILQSTEKPKLGFSSDIGKIWLANTTAIRSKVQKMHDILREGRGAAFHISPSHGMLSPFGQIKVKITSYNNLVGLYEDTLVCALDHWMRERIPVRLGVDGIPVKFSGAQLAVSKAGCNFERINFGTQVVQYGKRQSPAPFGTEVSKAMLRRSHQCLRSNESIFQAEFCKRDFVVENQSPRTVSLSWNVFTKRYSLTSLVAQKSDANHIPSTLEIDSLLLDELIDNDPMTAPLIVQPNPLIIPAFRSGAARVSFSAPQTGLFKSLLVADVGYVQSDGSVSFAPCPEQVTEQPIQDGTFEEKLLAPLKMLEETQLPFPEGIDLPRIRKVRLFVQAKAVEPCLKMADETGSIEPHLSVSSAVWFKRVKMNEELAAEILREQLRLEEARQQQEKAQQAELQAERARILEQHGKSASVFVYTDNKLGETINNSLFYSEPPSSSDSIECAEVSKGIGLFPITCDQEPPTSVVTLRNHTETAISFRISISSAEIFRVTNIEKPQTPATKPKRTQTCKSAKNATQRETPCTTVAAVPIGNSSAIPRMSITAQNSTGRMPFPEPVSATSLKKMLPVIPMEEEEEELADDFIYELHPMETIRIAVECCDVDILRSTSEEDNRVAPLTTDEDAGEISFGLSEATAGGQNEGTFANVKGHLKVIFTNGTVQSIPILCHK
ncbi:hypothetical protein BC830DRAFT_695893 [Chytriomyces sp. MP71]|nr:hypothetical protein BC830DRAFT_695893 [Chytriomyces sp. MP71]